MPSRQHGRRNTGKYADRLQELLLIRSPRTRAAEATIVDLDLPQDGFSDLDVGTPASICFVVTCRHRTGIGLSASRTSTRVCHPWPRTLHIHTGRSTKPSSAAITTPRYSPKNFPHMF